MKKECGCSACFQCDFTGHHSWLGVNNILFQPQPHQLGVQILDSQIFITLSAPFAKFRSFDCREKIICLYRALAGTGTSVCVCVCVCVRARARVRACAHARVHVSLSLSVSFCSREVECDDVDWINVAHGICLWETCEHINEELNSANGWKSLLLISVEGQGRETASYEQCTVAFTRSLMKTIYQSGRTQMLKLCPMLLYFICSLDHVRKLDSSGH